ncbi:hypothetical protein [Lacrimispora sp. JR3]|uniref:hypothetical protein n=1 Tax=Lacrimispora sinapis TaxID=3111456 RepID=UPI0037487099
MSNKYNRYRIRLRERKVLHMVVLEKKIGNTIIRAHDDCFVKTEEERQQILDNISRIASGIYQEKERKEKSG